MRQLQVARLMTEIVNYYTIVRALVRSFKLMSRAHKEDPKLWYLISQKKLLMHYVIFLLVTSGKITLCIRREQRDYDGLVCISLISQIFKILYKIFLVVGHLAIYAYNIWCHTTQIRQKYRAKQYNCPCTWKLPNKTISSGVYTIHHILRETKLQCLGRLTHTRPSGPE